MNDVGAAHNLVNGARRVALSFDNGPDPDTTATVLDTLRACGVPAHFFVIGRKLEAPCALDLMRRARAEGHIVGNHTYTHTTPLGLLGPSGVADEIVAAQDLLGDLAPERLFRPYGVQGRIGPHLLSPAARDHLIATGATCVLWNALPRDWLDPDGWVETGLAQCAALDWALVVLHDIPTGAMRHLPEFIGRLQDRSVQFTQDLPPDCLPIVAGRAMPGCEAYVSAPAMA